MFIALRSQHPVLRTVPLFSSSAAFSLLLAFSASAPAQTVPLSSETPALTQISALELPALPVAAPLADSLPDSPGVIAAASSSHPAAPEGSSSSLAEALADPQIANQQPGSQPSVNPQQRTARPSVASPFEMSIAPGQIAPHQTIPDKALGSLRDAVSPFSLIGELISAGYSQGTNGLPNFGTDGGAFLQRFGASVARGTSQNLFYEGVMASVLHEDARYYELGSKQNFFKRVVYAGTRPVITRTDGGRTTPNFALLTAYFGAAALTPVYYPEINHNGTDVLRTYGGSVGGAAIGDVVTEFLPDVLQFLHLKDVIHP